MYRQTRRTKEACMGHTTHANDNGEGGTMKLQDSTLHERVVITPEGRRLTLADLPRARVRWVKSRKRIVAYLVKGGALSLEEARILYRAGKGEIEGWMVLI